LADERGQQERPELTVDAAEPPSTGLTSDDDEPAPGGERAPEMREPTVAPDIEDHVVAVLAVCEVVAGVIDDVIGAEGSDRVHLRGAAYTGHLGSEGLGDLDGERAHASRRADDQHLLPVLDPSVDASLSGRARAYSANDASPMPNTMSPGLKPVTLLPTASTVPARLRPGLRYFGLRRPNPATRMG